MNAGLEYEVLVNLEATKSLGKVKAKNKEKAREKAMKLISNDVPLCWFCSKKFDELEVSKVIVKEDSS